MPLYRYPVATILVDNIMNNQTVVEKRRQKTKNNIKAGQITITGKEIQNSKRQ